MPLLCTAPSSLSNVHSQRQCHCAVSEELFELTRRYFLATLDLGGGEARFDLGTMVPPAQGFKITHPDSDTAVTPGNIKSIMARCMQTALDQAMQNSGKSVAVCKVRSQNCQSLLTPNICVVNVALAHNCFLNVQAVMTSRGQQIRNALTDPNKPPDSSFNAFNVKFMHKWHRELMANFLTSHPSPVEKSIVKIWYVRTSII
jgi:hypothetical protein